MISLIEKIHDYLLDYKYVDYELRHEIMSNVAGIVDEWLSEVCETIHVDTKCDDVIHLVQETIYEDTEDARKTVAA